MGHRGEASRKKGLRRNPHKQFLLSLLTYNAAISLAQISAISLPHKYLNSCSLSNSDRLGVKSNTSLKVMALCSMMDPSLHSIQRVGNMLYELSTFYAMLVENLTQILQTSAVRYLRVANLPLHVTLHVTKTLFSINDYGYA